MSTISSASASTPGAGPAPSGASPVDVSPADVPPADVPPADAPRVDDAAAALEAARAFDSSVREAVVVVQRALLALGRRLVEAHEEGHLRALGFSGIAHYAETRGIAPPARANDLARIGEFLHQHADSEHAFLEGQMTLESASALCQVADAQSEGRWLAAAVEHTSGTFRRLVREEQVRRGERLATQRKVIEARELDLVSFEDARNQVSRDEGSAVTEGEALGVISRFYLRERDPKRRRTHPEGVVCSKPPKIIPGARTVPSVIARRVWHRDGGQCRVPGCTNTIWIELAHIRARADGGAPSADNLLCLCRLHNMLMETGELVVRGNAEQATFHQRDGAPFTTVAQPNDSAPP